LNAHFPAPDLQLTVRIAPEPASFVQPAQLDPHYVALVAAESVATQHL
jgi:hypothetical protein